MAFVIKFVKGVRNHWKKSTFAVIALSYGANYTKEYYQTQELMRAYCEKAVLYGRQPISENEIPEIVTVILNPNANKRKALADFEKYCAPILNLAGICVDVLQTESEGHAKTLIENLRSTDAVVVAGGDGTLSEVITGFMRQSELENIELPIGVLPLGRSNTIGKFLFPGGDNCSKVRSLADASLAIIEKTTKPIDIMKVEVINEDDTKSKATYAVSAIEWGAYRDAHAKRDKYWYFGPFRNYATYIFNGYKNNLSWNCEANINYTLPCEGCLNCIKQSNKDKSRVRWYHRFLPHRSKVQPDNVPKAKNDFCQTIHEKHITTSDFAIETTNTLSNFNQLPQLRLNLGPNSVDYFNFVTQGWQSENGLNRITCEVIEAKEIEIKPFLKAEQEKEHWFSIDKEEFEVKPVKVTLLPKAIKMYCKKMI